VSAGKLLDARVEAILVATWTPAATLTRETCEIIIRATLETERNDAKREAGAELELARVWGGELLEVARAASAGRSQLDELLSANTGRAHRAEALVDRLREDARRTEVRHAALLGVVQSAAAERVDAAFEALVAVEPLVHACRYASPCGACLACKYRAALAGVRARAAGDAEAAAAIDEEALQRLHGARCTFRGGNAITAVQPGWRCDLERIPGQLTCAQHAAAHKGGPR
jgi:hypothetical protein